MTRPGLVAFIMDSLCTDAMDYHDQSTIPQLRNKIKIRAYYNLIKGLITRFKHLF